MIFNIKDAILVNQYGQGLITIDPFKNLFKDFDLDEKRSYLKGIVTLLLQSNPDQGDIEPAIEQSMLRLTYTPCILLRKGVAYHHLKRLIDLPDNEQEKSLMLLMSLFKIAYQRRFLNEMNLPHKWWYWDLSDERNVDLILNSDSPFINSLDGENLENP